MAETTKTKPLVVVTGATGLLGSNLAIELLNQGYQVRCTKRKTSKTSHLAEYPQIEWFDADLGEREALKNAVDGSIAVYHCAAMVQTLRTPTPELVATNVQGTQNVIDAILASSTSPLPRLIHCSSVVGIGVAESPDKPADENTPWNFEEWGLNDGYTLTKSQAEHKVQDALKANPNLDAVIVNPTFMIGAYDQGPSSGGLIIELHNGTVPAIPGGRMNFVDVEAVAKGMYLAFQKGRRGERYILGGHNLTYHDFFHLVGRELGFAPPPYSIPRVLALGLGWLGEVKQWWSGQEENLNISRVRYAYCENWVFSSEKARKELDYPILPLEPAIHRAVKWWKSKGMYPEER